jgi:hypothetical protein
MSWLSAAWQRNKGAIGSIVGAVPVVGGVLKAGVNAINTGDYKNVPVPAGNAALAAEAQRVQDFAKAEADRVREMAAAEVARIGYASTTQAAAAIGPPGNIYQSALAFNAKSPLAIAGYVALGLLVLFLVLKAGGKK